jgi:hypothetical protein
MEQKFPNVNRTSFRAQKHQEPKARKRAKGIVAIGVITTQFCHFLGQVFFGFQALDSVEIAHLAEAPFSPLVSHSTGRQEKTQAFPASIKLDHLICEPRGQKRPSQIQANTSEPAFHASGKPQPLFLIDQFLDDRTGDRITANAAVSSNIEPDKVALQIEQRATTTRGLQISVVGNDLTESIPPTALIHLVGGVIRK